MPRPHLLALLTAALLVPLMSAAAGPPPRARSAPAPVRSATAAGFDRVVKPFLARHCVACHNTKSPTADLNLERFPTPASLEKNPETWEHIVRKVRSGEMPPKGAARPPAAAVRAFTGWVAAEIARLEQAAPADPGRVTARRLNRAEYNNTVRDLLGVALRPADDFPQDDSGYSFDNIGDVLSLSPVLMEKYLTAAERVARTAVYGAEAEKPFLVQIRPPARRHEPRPKPLSEYDLTGLTLPNALHVTHLAPVEAEYLIRVHLEGARPLGSEPLTFALWVDGKQVATSTFDPEGRAAFDLDRQSLSANVLELRAPLSAGEHLLSVSVLRLYEGLPASFGGPNPSKRSAPPPPDPSRVLRFFQPPPNATPEQLEEFRQRRERILERIRERSQVAIPANDARVRFIEVGGPYPLARDPHRERRYRLFTCGHADGGHGPGCTRKIVGDLTRRAFRRPAVPAEVDRYVRLAEEARSSGAAFGESLSVAVQAILVSPHFLFRIERGQAPAAGAAARPITQYELASRLSYFLWSSMPDDVLLRLADTGMLRQPTVLEAQVRRMLRDPKALALVENFGGQWLELRKLESVKPDPERFPEFDPYLRFSMRRETERFFEHLLREDRSLLEFLDADYTFLNERLARHYGIPGVQGPELRQVSLAGTRRGGLLTQAAVLTVSSYSTRTSPVLRGKWILENILNAPPPPPPPGVPNLDETKIGQAASLRRQLEAHRANPTCASCHDRLDPLGFALENFDAIGRWRTVEGEVPIDTSASLPDGRTLQGPDELRAVLRADSEAFAGCVTEKLLIYALGRGLERYDKRTVRNIVSRGAAADYRLTSLVLEIVQSLPFQMRRGDPAL